MRYFRCLVLLVVTLAACERPEIAREAAAPVALEAQVEDGIGAPAKDDDVAASPRVPCDTPDDGIGGTGCKTP